MLEANMLSLAPVLLKTFHKVADQFIREQESASSTAVRDLDPAGGLVHTIKPIFGRYVTRNAGFAVALKNVQLVIQSYANRSKAQRPLNLLLAAAPGTGKSFLIKEMLENIGKAQKQKIGFMEYYVPSFRSLDDLFGVFNYIQSSNLKGELPVVFFDEFDTKVESRYILSNLLAPMWDGAFYQGRDKHTLGKSVLVFAGSTLTPEGIIDEAIARVKSTKQQNQLVEYDEFLDEWMESFQRKIDELSSNDEGGVEKCKDFVDRVDQVVCIPPISSDLTGDDADREFVDIACILVKKNFEGITHIQLAAINAVSAMLRIATSKRRAEKMVFGSQLPNDYCFKFSDLPPADQQRLSFAQNVPDWDSCIEIKFAESPHL